MYVYSKDWVLVDTVLWAVGRNTNTMVLGCELSRVQVRGNIVVNTLQNCTVPGVYALGHMAGKVLLTAGRRLAHRILVGSPSPPFPFPSLLPSSVTFFTLLPCYKSLGCNEYGVSQYVPELVPIKTYVVSANTAIHTAIHSRLSTCWQIWDIQSHN